MKRAAKMAVGAVAFVAPVAAGWSLTGGSTPLDLDIGIGGHHTIDEFDVDGYQIVVEDIDGTVTETVTGPDGNVVAPEDVPAEIADQVDHMGTLDDPPTEVDTSQSPPCWRIVGVVGGEQHHVGTGPEDGYAFRANPGPGGTTVVEAVYFDGPPDERLISDNDDGYVDTGGPLADLDGAIEMGECP